MDKWQRSVMNLYFTYPRSQKMGQSADLDHNHTILLKQYMCWTQHWSMVLDNSHLKHKEETAEKMMILVDG